MGNAKNIICSLTVLAGMGVVVTPGVRTVNYRNNNPHRNESVIEKYEDMKQSLQTLVDDRNELKYRGEFITTDGRSPEDAINLEIAYGIDRDKIDAFNSLISRQQSVMNKFWDEHPAISNSQEWDAQGAEFLNPGNAWPYLFIGGIMGILGMKGIKKTD